MCAYITAIVVFWKQAGTVWDADDTKVVGENGGFVSFVLNFVFYAIIVQQACCVLCSLCACCAVAVSGPAVITSKLQMQRDGNYGRM